MYYNDIYIVECTLHSVIVFGWFEQITAYNLSCKAMNTIQPAKIFHTGKVTWITKNKYNLTYFNDWANLKDIYVTLSFILLIHMHSRMSG